MTNQTRSRRRIVTLSSLLFALAMLNGNSTSAQQVTIGAPMTNSGSSFYENFGIGWGFNIPTGNPAAGGHGVVGFGPNGPQQGIGFGFGGPANVPFGLGNANPANLGFQVGGNGGRANFGIFAEQGASTTLSSQTPMITVMNGQQGYFASTIQRPFVTGLIPVVGDGGVGYAPTVVYPSMSIPWPNPNDGQRGASVVNERWARIMANESARVSRPDSPAPAPVAAAAPVARAPGRSSAERGAPSLAEIRRAQAAEEAAKDQAPPTKQKRLKLEE